MAPAKCRSEGLPLRDMLSLGAWRMGLGCSGKILPSSSPLSPASFWTNSRNKSHFFVISYDKLHFGTFLFIRMFFLSYFRIMSNPSQKAIYSSRNKSQMAQNEKVFFHEQLGLRSTS